MLYNVHVTRREGTEITIDRDVIVAARDEARAQGVISLWLLTQPLRAKHYTHVGKAEMVFDETPDLQEEDWLDVGGVALLTRDERADLLAARIDEVRHGK